MVTMSHSFSKQHNAVDWYDNALSDSEAGKANKTQFKNSRRYYQFSSSLPSMKNLMSNEKYSSLLENEDNYTDDENTGVHAFSSDEFVDSAYNRGKSVRTGRQRKKLAARSKGSEFRANRKKKRVYFCCISSEIDIPKLLDHLLEGGELLGRWKYRVYSDVLHLYKEEQNKRSVSETIPINIARYDDNRTECLQPSSYDPKHPVVAGSLEFDEDGCQRDRHLLIEKKRASSAASDGGYCSYNEDALPSNQLSYVNNFSISHPGSQEVFIFDFGAAVLWGVPRGEESHLLRVIRQFVTKGMVEAQEFSSGEDDMAFVTSSDAKTITIANDVIELPENSEPKQRLSVSFAIAQSSVLSIFESRIEKKVEEYKYIPEALKAHGKIHLSELQLGMMIGEVFVIRHDVNLHTEILGNFE